MSKKKTSIAWTNIHVLYGRRIWTLVKNMYNENKSLTKDELLIEIEKNILVLFDEIFTNYSVFIFNRWGR